MHYEPDDAWLDSLSDSEKRPSSYDPAPPEEVRSDRRAALFVFGIAFVVALVGGVTLVMALTSDDGGIVWIGGIILGALWMIRSVFAFFSAGQRRISNGVWAAGMAGLLLAFVVGMLVVMKFAPTSPAVTYPVTNEIDASTVAGLCWNKDGYEYEITGAVVEADCAYNHDLVSGSLVAGREDCPSTSAGAMKTSDERYLCLEPDRWDQ